MKGKGKTKKVLEEVKPLWVSEASSDTKSRRNASSVIERTDRFKNINEIEESINRNRINI